MRRIAAGMICLAVLTLAASPAWAQKDPFDPLITEESTTTQPSDGTATTDTTDTTDTTTTVDSVAPADEPMPTTGTDPSSWVGLAVLAIALGGGLLVLVRVLDPPYTGGRIVSTIRRTKRN
jgi:hypothetical protein